MAQKLKIPEFENEQREAAWWPTQEDKIANTLEQADIDGTLQRSPVQERSGGIAPTTIRLDPKDIERARQQAGRKGLRYQTYLKMLIHEALQREDRRVS